MTNDTFNHGCGFEETIVAYVYGEVSDVEKRVLDQHMAHCPACSSELASFRAVHDGISTMSRTVVLDRPLVNPAEGTTAGASSETIWKSLERLVSVTPRTIGAAAAVAAILTASLFLSLRSGAGPDPVEIASNSGADWSQPAAAKPAAPETPDTADSSSSQAVRQTPLPNRESVGNSVTRPVRAVKSKAVAVAPAPPATLSEVEETSDDSLRLSDIFAELSMD